MENPFFFESGANRLFGVLHTPDRSIANRGFVLIHPFGEEKLWSHRVFVNFAREAASRGFPVLRFDLAGHGDSDSHSELCSVDSYLADIEAAKLNFSQNFPQTKEITLLGLRLGATLAYLNAARFGDASSLILWEPIIDGARYMQELLRINLSTQLAVYGSIKNNREVLVNRMRKGALANVDGYLISNFFFEKCSEIDFTYFTDANLNKPILLVQISANLKQKDRAELVNLAHELPEASVRKVEEPPFWREIKPFSSRAANLISSTFDWLESQYGA